jgi:hypothetical protein
MRAPKLHTWVCTCGTVVQLPANKPPNRFGPKKKTFLCPACRPRTIYHRARGAPRMFVDAAGRPLPLSSALSPNCSQSTLT